MIGYCFHDNSWLLTNNALNLFWKKRIDALEKDDEDSIKDRPYAQNVFYTVEDDVSKWKCLNVIRVHKLKYISERFQVSRSKLTHLLQESTEQRIWYSSRLTRVLDFKKEYRRLEKWH